MKLFERGKIGPMTLKNRIILDALNIQLATPGEHAGLTPRAIDFYAARAKGGAGLIKTTFMRPNHKLEFSIGDPVVNSERSVSWLNDLAEAVHDYGAKVCVQMSPGLGRIPIPKAQLPHGGLVSSSASPSIREADGQMPRVAPGRYPVKAENPVTVRELTTEEIEQLVKDFENSARIIRMADIDAIEIHGHQGYLLDQFLTPLWNKRTDKYGGSFEGRMRLAVELVEAIKNGAGEDFPILFKYALTHYMEGGREVEEGLEIARKLEAAGVDALQVNGGCYETYDRAQPATTKPKGCWLDLTEMTKKVVKVPVIAVGKLGYPDLAEQVLQDEKADFIALGRYLLADPDWPNKVKAGREEDIIPCVGCHEGCVARVRKYKHLSCAVNPTAGAEKALTIHQAPKRKSVLVIGGGPGGMEAARVSALRGHKVTLWERQDVLGGNLIPAAIPDFKDDYRRLTDYLITQVKKLKVNIELGKEATVDLIRSAHPEVVFIATGAVSAIPMIEGIEEGMNEGRIATAIDVLLSRNGVGKSVVVLGAGLIGCETALHLARKGRRVTIAGGRRLAHDMVWGNAVDLMKLLDDHRVEICPNNRIVRFTKDGAESDSRCFEADTFVLAVGMNSVTKIMAEDLEDHVPEVCAIGDCVSPRHVMSAIWEGYRRAYVI